MSTLVTFGEAVLSTRPKAQASSLPLATPACEVIQAVGGAELNVAVAFSRTASDSKAAWVSTLPTGALGDHVIAAAADASVDTGHVVRDMTPHSVLGTLHVVDDGSGPRPHYQRHQSSFCTTISGGTFDWQAVLAPASWLHVTGITPLLGDGPRAAWQAAIGVAATPQTARCHVSVDLNHRPALGSLDELWGVIAPWLSSGAVTFLMLSEDTLRKLAEREGVWTGPPSGDATGAASRKRAHDAMGAADEVSAGAPLVADALHDAQRAALASLRERWGVPLLGCGFKRPKSAFASKSPAPAAPSPSSSAPPQHKDTLKGGGGVVRWSVIASAAGEASTRDTPTVHQPLEALGGGDAWMGGFLSSLLPDTSTFGNLPLDDRMMSLAALRSACRRGDLLAALSMAKLGDLSDVDGASLRAAEQTWAKKTAMLAQAGALVGGAAAAGDAPRASAYAPAAYARLGRAKIVPVVAIDDPDDAAPVARALLAGGLDVMELVLRTPSAEESLRRIASQMGESMFVGAGTVLSVSQAERAVAAGAKFIVSPGTNPKVVEWCTAREMPIVPGVATATEIEAAMGLGLTHLKFFPAEANGGVKTLKALGGPYAKVRFMPTGGVTESNLPSYLGLPSVFCAGGTWLVPASALEKKDYKAIEVLARAAAEQARSIS